MPKERQGGQEAAEISRSDRVSSMERQLSAGMAPGVGHIELSNIAFQLSREHIKRAVELQLDGKDKAEVSGAMSKAAGYFIIGAEHMITDILEQKKEERFISNEVHVGFQQFFAGVHEAIEEKAREGKAVDMFALAVKSHLAVEMDALAALESAVRTHVRLIRSSENVLELNRINDPEYNVLKGDLDNVHAQLRDKLKEDLEKAAFMYHEAAKNAKAEGDWKNATRLETYSESLKADEARNFIMSLPWMTIKADFAALERQVSDSS